MSTHSPDHPPLEATWIEREIEIVVAGQRVRGTARANWGAMQVAITFPITNAQRGWDGRGWTFAMAAHHRPEMRYACAGDLTLKGIDTARRMLAEIYLDWRAVTSHAAAIADACRRTRHELDQRERRLKEQLHPLHLERLTLRAKFKAKGMTQQHYQQQRKALRERQDSIEMDARAAQRRTHETFLAWMKAHCGRAISLDEVERLQAAVVVNRGRS